MHIEIERERETRVYLYMHTYAYIHVYIYHHQFDFTRHVAGHSEGFPFYLSCLLSGLVATAFIDGCTDGEDFGALVTAVPVEWTESTMYILAAWNFPSALPLEI